ncbi:KTR mannosyltransferase [Encephalitozoon intestinalis ATCC 50506]|uniref:KTR mannosyltransferase n=1 Tax=Encephalitozoon intestinalis (strain ATCC 50506) TaxID=876142 RepID=E0S6R5_ENCIT|nr:KTR mannosyltransferase [Encephalitozoon intestinalis ATCC 50506]ADM11400.1 KTR mannosyltransferase [Encephalitozoon intestinalis ATCC 50506]UTX45091.1 glycolipid 2-alpha-mannosyltransferase [Encephalitozoon intestinalis]
MLLLLTIVGIVVCRENAVILILCRNSDKNGITETIKNFEEVFNRNFGYPYVFLNDEEFTEDFKKAIKDVTSNSVEFGRLEPEEWEIPKWIDMEKAKEEMKKMEDRKIIYGGSLSYRKMCRFFSGFFYRNKLVQKYDYYWRIEPDVKFLCQIEYDPFTYLRENNKQYGFVISLVEFMETIPSLFGEVIKFATHNLNLIKKANGNRFILNKDGSYNGCHFWSNFEIANFGFFRNETYQKYFDWLDKAGGFFYERWGDAPVHSIAASLFLDKDQIHFFSDIGYEHPPFQHCPREASMRSKCKCSISNSLDFSPNSCLGLYIKSLL